MPIPALTVLVPTHPRVAALDRLGDEIAELAAHLEAATARLLTLIRDFDARGGWNTGKTRLSMGKAQAMPYSGGSSLHGAPVHRTHRMPS
ncbi:MAG: hypothetical protein ACREJS_04515 [Candidatus Rokuibacteriota bacterium]